MRLLALTICFLLISTTASACVSFEPYWSYGVEPPPASYLNKIPSVPVNRAYVDDPDAVCHALYGDDSDYFVEACTVLLATECDVILPTEDADDLYGQGLLAALDTHEVKGHCNGLVHIGNTGRGWQTRDGVEVTS